MGTMKNWLSAVLVMAISTVFAQQKITGKIIDDELNSGIPGVNVIVKGTTTATVTDID